MPEKEDCTRCGGTGSIPEGVDDQGRPWVQPCPDCDGKGSK